MMLKYGHEPFFFRCFALRYVDCSREVFEVAQDCAFQGARTCRHEVVGDEQGKEEEEEEVEELRRFHAQTVCRGDQEEGGVDDVLGRNRRE